MEENMEVEPSSPSKKVSQSPVHSNETNDNGSALLNGQPEQFDLYHFIIENIRKVEERKTKIIEEEISLRTTIKALNQEEKDTIEHCKELLQRKEVLRTDLIRLKELHGKMTEELAGVQALELEIKEINEVNLSIGNSLNQHNTQLKERILRLLAAKPSTIGEHVSVSTDISGPLDDSTSLYSKLQEVISKKLDLVETEIIHIVQEKQLFTRETLNDLLNEGREIKDKIRELKYQMNRQNGNESDSSKNRSGKRSGSSRRTISRKRVKV